MARHDETQKLLRRQMLYPSELRDRTQAQGGPAGHEPNPGYAPRPGKASLGHRPFAAYRVRYLGSRRPALPRGFRALIVTPEPWQKCLKNKQKRRALKGALLVLR